MPAVRYTLRATVIAGAAPPALVRLQGYPEAEDLWLFRSPDDGRWLSVFPPARPTAPVLGLPAPGALIESYFADLMEVTHA